MADLKIFRERVLQKKAQLSGAFKPGTPINHQDLFTGRLDQVNEVLNAALQSGRHAILFGERGVGKTSLARIIATIISAAGHKPLNCGTINCEKADDFSSLWRRVFREMTMTVESNEAGFRSAPKIEDLPMASFLPNRELQPDDIRYALTRIGAPSLIVIDEIDILESRRVRSQLAETIKNLSDHAVETTLILVGVADSVVGLIAEHESIERSLVQVAMPRMSAAELIEIVNKGLRASDMTVEDGVQPWIAQLSQGLPHYTHSLALYAGFAAAEDGRSQIRVDDVLTATRVTVEKSHSLKHLYHSAVTSQQPQSIYAAVLRACALVETDELGYFSAVAIRPTLSLIVEKDYDVPNYSRHLHDLCLPRRGSILAKRGEPRRVRFRFRDPVMQPFVILHDYSVGLLTNELILESRGRMRAESDTKPSSH